MAASTKFVSLSNAEALMRAIGTKFAALNGAYVIKGNSAFASLPATPTAAQTGFVYNVTDQFTTDSRFVEGSGKKYPANTNVVIVNLGDATVPNMKFDVIGAFIDMDAINTALTGLQLSLAPAFSESEAYSEGDVVTHEHALYAFNTDHVAGDWDDTEVDAVDVLDLLEEAAGDVSALETRFGVLEKAIAPEFAPATTYAIGDVVEYGDEYYVFTAAHTGAWTGSDVTKKTVVQIVDDKIAAAQTAIGLRIDTVLSNLADEFDDATAYSAGEVVTYNDVMYRFTSDHSAGAWTGSDATAIKVEDLEPAALTTAEENTLIGYLNDPAGT